jgi:endonuclease YncB( thermonuclease family)
MDIEMQEWFAQLAIEHMRRIVADLRTADGALAMTADGHLLHPPIYPAYQRNSFEAYADHQGFWVYWFQKDSADSPWERPRRLVRAADLR